MSIQRRKAVFLTLVAVGCAAVAAGGPVGGKGGLRAPGLTATELTQVFVLASPHLGQQMPVGTKWDGLNDLLDALARYKPDLIAVEALPSDLVRAYECQAPKYDEVLRTFAGEAWEVGKAAQQAVNLDHSGAMDRAVALLDSFAGTPGDSVPVKERKRAALLLTAAYELPSAALQWSYLPTGQRVTDDEVPAQTVEMLNQTLSARNETVSVGLALARRMGLQRLYGVDDQSDAQFQIRFGGKLMEGLSQSPEMAKLQKSVLVNELPERLREHGLEGDFVGLYRWMNSTAYATADVDAQWHIFYRTRLVSGLDRARAGHWEVRNLRIAANIRTATAEANARRALVIIGASHKPFLDAYLRTMMDVEVVDAESLLSR